jgi:hypothetical protein
VEDVGVRLDTNPVPMGVSPPDKNPPPAARATWKEEEEEKVEEVNPGVVLGISCPTMGPQLAEE